QALNASSARAIFFSATALLSVFTLARTLPSMGVRAMRSPADNSFASRPSCLRSLRMDIESPLRIGRFPSSHETVTDGNQWYHEQVHACGIARLPVNRRNAGRPCDPPEVQAACRHIARKCLEDT